MAIVRAKQVFNAEAGFTEEEIARINQAGAGKTVAFGRISNSELLISNQRGNEAMLEEFARGKTADELVAGSGMSRRQFFYLLKKERAEGLKGSRVEEWKRRGLSLREIGRLYGMSHEAIRQTVNGERRAPNGGTTEAG